MPFFLLKALRSFFTMVSVNRGGRFAAVNVNFCRRVGANALWVLFGCGRFYIIRDDDESERRPKKKKMMMKNKI